MMMPGYSLYNHKKCKYKHTNTQLQTHKYTSTFIQVQISNIHTPKHEHICGKHEPLWSHRDAQAQRRVHTAAIFRLGALQNIYGAEPTSNVHGFCIFNPKLMYHPLIIQMAIVFVNKKLEVVSYPLIMILQLMDYRHIMLITILMANVHISNFKYFILIFPPAAYILSTAREYRWQSCFWFENFFSKKWLANYLLMPRQWQSYL